MKTICVDLGGSRVKTAIVENGNITGFDMFSLSPGMSTADILRETAEKVRRTDSRESCTGIGVAFAGIVDAPNARVVTSNGKYPDAPRTDFTLWAREAFGLPLKMANDASAALCGEMAYGCGRGFSDAVLMTVGTGIGTAAFSGGRILYGKHGTQGILGGHIAVSFRKDARRCTCGNVGCLEAYAGTWALEGLAREDPRFPDSILAKAVKIDYLALSRGRAAGDALCASLLEDAGRALAAGAVSLVHAYDPEVLILSGGAVRAEGMAEAIRDHVARYAWTPWGHVKIRTAENPEASVLLGLHALFAEDFR